MGNVKMEEKSDEIRKNEQANLETQVFGFQRRVLQIFGFAPSAARRVKSIRIILWLISAVIFLIAVGELVYQIAILVCELKHPTPEVENNIVLTILTYAPYIAESVRGISVLILLISKRKSWQHLAHFADEIVNETYPNHYERRQRLGAWRKFAVIFGFGTIVLHFLWEVAVFFHDYEHVFWPPIVLDNNTNNSNDDNNSHDSNNHTRKLWIPNQHTDSEFEHAIWRLMNDPWPNFVASVAESIPFCLSQQIFAIIIVLAFVLHGGSKILNQRISALREETEIKLDQEQLMKFQRIEISGGILNWNKRKEDLKSGWCVEKFSEKAAALQNFHLRLVLLSHEINHFFGWMLFFIYGMDVVTLNGFVALFVTKDSQMAPDRALFLGSVALFGFFATIFYVPLVQAQEQAARVTFELHRLIGMTAKLQAKEKHLQKRLEVFCTASKRHNVMFEGAGLLHVTRMFVVTTFTMTLSIGVLTYEVLNLKEHS